LAVNYFYGHDPLNYYLLVPGIVSIPLKTDSGSGDDVSKIFVEGSVIKTFATNVTKPLAAAAHICISL